MFRIGCHLSSSGGFLKMGKEAVRLGAGTFQFFTRNPRGGRAKALDPADREAYLAYAREHDLARILGHAPYTLNACAGDEGLREFAARVMADDLRRLSFLPGAMYNFHPGSHVGQGTEKGIVLIADLLNGLLEEGTETTVLLETMAGKGSEVGRGFEELAAVIQKVERKEKLGVCLDTCHVFDAGYDVKEDLEGVLAAFEESIGLDRLQAVHLNDSLYGLASHKDRHAGIGEGKIGLAAMERIINHPALREKPFYLETPGGEEAYAREIALLKQCYREEASDSAIR